MPMLQILPKPLVIETVIQAQELLSELKKQRIVGLDTETTSLNVREATMLCWTVSWPQQGRTKSVRAMISSIALTLEVFADWLADPGFHKVLHHAKYDKEIFANHGMEVRGIRYDTLIIDWLLDENRQGHHDLKSCAKDHLGLNMEPFADMLKEERADGFQDLPDDMKVEYATKDAWATVELVHAPSLIWGKPLPQVLREHPAAIPGKPNRTLHDHLLEVEMPFVETLQLMERRGICIDRGYLLDLDPVMEKELEDLQFKANHLAGAPIKLNSPKQLRDLIYGKMGLTPTKWTKGGESGNRQPAVDQSVIEAEAKKEKAEGRKGIFCTLERYRKVHKVRSTYVRGLLKASEPPLSPDYRIHSSFHTDLVTGRLSSSKPNLQNIPNAKKDAFQLRGAFTATPAEEAGNEEQLLIVADYSTLEMRIAAHLSEDRDMIQAIIDGVDIHSRTAASMYGLDYDEIIEAKKKPKNQQTEQDQKLLRARDDAKIIGFGLIYGMQAYALSINLHCDPSAAQEKMNLYFATYPGIAQWIIETKKKCRETGFVQTVLGRYRRLLDIRKGMDRDSEGRWVANGDRLAASLRRHAENQAINTPVQGTAADIAKVAMTQTSESKEHGDQQLQRLGCFLLLQVHDELIWECPTRNVDRAISRIRLILEHPFDFDLKVPLSVDIGVGFAWSDAK